MSFRTVTGPAMMSVLLIGGACSGESGPTGADGLAGVTTEASGNLLTEGQALIVAGLAIDAFDLEYGCPIDTNVSLSDLSGIDNVFSSSVVVLGTADTGEMTIDLDRINMFDTDVESKENIVEVVATHEESHSCNAGRVEFDSPIDLGQITAVAAKGFILIADDGTTFNFVDEAAAELFTRNILGVGANSPALTRLADHMRELTVVNDISAKQLQQLQESSDLLSLIAQISGLEKEELTPAQINAVLDGFFFAFQG